MNESEINELTRTVRRLAVNQNEMILSMLELWRVVEQSSVDLSIRSLCVEKMEQLDTIISESFSPQELSLIDDMTEHLTAMKYGTIAF